MIYLILIAYFIVVLLLLLWQWSNIYSVMIGAPPVSSPHHDLWKKVADRDKTFLDLGCGIGSVCLRAAPYFQHVYGIELSPMYYLISRIRAARYKNVTIMYGNIFTLPWPKVDYIYCYLMPKTLKKLKPKFKKAESTVLSYAFSIDGWQPKEVIEKEKKRLIVYQSS